MALSLRLSPANFSPLADPSHAFHHDRTIRADLMSLCRCPNSPAQKTSSSSPAAQTRQSSWWGNAKQFNNAAAAGGLWRKSKRGPAVRAMAEKEVVVAKGMAKDGPGKGGKWLSSTTRHVRLYIGVADPETFAMDQTQLDKVTLMLDPDNEFLWPEDKVQKVYDYFRELVDAYTGAPLTEYTLRLIGSDIEHYIRKLLLANEIKYNLECKVLNFSMGKPRYASGFEQTEE